jgi:hypothetical protein
MGIRHKLFSPNTVLAADDLTDVANNGVVSIASTADLDDANLANVNVVYVQSETKLRVRKSAGLGIAHWSSPFDSTVPAYYATISKTGYGQFTVSNYNAEFYYDATGTAGTVQVTNNGSSCIITSTGATNTIITLNERASFDGESKITMIERKAYTYHTENQQSCYNNCMPGGGPSGPSSCWCGTSSDGYGTCCGGCYGQTCTGDPAASVKDGTPSGYTDANGEWWKTWTI